MAPSEQTGNGGGYLRVIAGALLLLPASWFTWQTIEGLKARRDLRTELAEISHVRYGILNADRWRDILVPILNAQIDALDFQLDKQAGLRPMVEKALYRLLDQVKDRMSAQQPANPAPAAEAGGLLGGLFGGGGAGGGNAMIANMMVGALKPHVPEYATIVMQEFGRPENKRALKNYIRNVLVEGAQKTFGNVDKRWYEYILKKHGCTEATPCQQQIGNEIAGMEAAIQQDYAIVLGSSAVAFLLLMVGVPALRRPSVLLLMLFCLVLLAGGVLTPMLEVEAKISRVSLSILGQKVVFENQLLYFQSKSVLEVFKALITKGRADMWFVGVLVLMFSVVFPILKILTLGVCLFRPSLLRVRVVRFFALESSKWSMADVMALAIFMSYVAFNGLIANTMSGLQETGAELLIPTDSSKILPGYYLFIGFVLASLFLSKKLERGIRAE